MEDVVVVVVCRVSELFVELPWRIGLAKSQSECEGGEEEHSASEDSNYSDSAPSHQSVYEELVPDVMECPPSPPSPELDEQISIDYPDEEGGYEWS